MRLVMEQKQMLKMVMTTELRQAIELLQLSTYELMQFVQKQAEENPFIEFVENDSYQASYEKRPRRKTTHSEVDPLDFVTGHEKSMHEQLLEQLTWMQLTNNSYKILHYLILNINEQGFLTLTEEEIATHFDLNMETVEANRNLLFRLEPIGIGATDVTECLLIQAQMLFPEDAILHRIIEDYLKALAEKKWQKIAKELNIELRDVKMAFEKIQTLNPRPAAIFESTKTDYVTPDIVVTFDETEQIHTVQLNDHYIPSMHFNRAYTEELPNTKEVSQYVQGNFKKFEWLQKSIMQRRDTIIKIMEVIIRHQAAFLKDGFRSLKPLTLKDVAEEIDMHESTVSRATANKIVQTPTGTFELRHLFSTKLATSDGDDTSQTTVKEMIRELVEVEDKYRPLSDQKIANMLKDEKEIVISRRTVAKYRDELQIPSSSKRKEIKVI